MKENCRKEKSIGVPGVASTQPVLLVLVTFFNANIAGKTSIVTWGCKRMSIEIPCRFCGTLLKRFKDTADQDVCSSLECVILILKELANNQVGGAMKNDD